MRRALGTFIVAVIAVSGAWTQQPVSDNGAATKEDVERLFGTLHLRDQMQSMMGMSMQQAKQIAHDTIRKKDPQVKDTELQRMDAFLDNFSKTLDTGGMLDDMIPVYQRHLTKEDVAAMLAFYETPTGQKILREQPAMMAEAMQAMRPRMEKMMSDITEQAEKMAKEEQKDTNPPANK